MNTIAKTNGSGTIRSHLESPAFKDAIAKALPRHLTPDRFIRVACTTLMKTPKLASCDQASFFNALLTLSQLGIEADGRRAHLIPFENRKRGVVECQLIVDYKGLAELVMRSGLVSYLHADVVCENDEFEYDCGELKKHRINFRAPRGEVYAVYAIVKFKDGSGKADVMTREDVESIRKRSRAGSNGPWVSDWNEMAKKGLSVETPIPTPDGWVRMCQLEVGSSVFDMNGHPTKVVAVSEIKHLPCYRVTFSNGDAIICDDEHRWFAAIGSSASANVKRNGWRVHEIEDLYRWKSQGLPITMPISKPLCCPAINLPISPWVLGYWLGNGTSRAAAFTCHSDDAAYVKARLQHACMILGKSRVDPRSKAVTLRVKGGLLLCLRKLRLLQNKHVPSEYLRASKDQRLELLHGLMDSDGHIEKKRGRAMFGSVNLRLTDAVSELAISLGETVHRSARMQKGFGSEVMFYSVAWKPTTICPVSLPRKAANSKSRKLAHYRSVKSIEKIPSVATKCIAVESETKSYLAGLSMVPTHNTVFRRLSKWLPLSPEFRDAVDADEDAIDITTAPVATKSLVQEVSEGFELPQGRGEALPSEDEAAEAAAGLAPERDPEPTMTSQPEPPPTNSPQQQVQALVEAAGHDFATFIRCMDETGGLKDASSFPDWDAIPGADCSRLIKALTGKTARPVMLENLRLAKEAIGK